MIRDDAGHRLRTFAPRFSSEQTTRSVARLSSSLSSLPSALVRAGVRLTGPPPRDPSAESYPIRGRSSPPQLRLRSSSGVPASSVFVVPLVAGRAEGHRC